MQIEAKILLPGIYVLNFKTQYELCMSFVRMQEFYESPKFRGKYFTLEEYIDYWSKEFGNGSFTYPSVWNGFNIPGKVIYDWFEKFTNIRPKEEDIVIQINKLIKKEVVNPHMEADRCLEYYKKIYIIGAHGEDGKESSNHIIEHELAHAMYYFYSEYRENCQKLLKKVSKKDYNNAKKLLLKQGYENRVIDDELQAYFSAEVVCKKNDILRYRLEFAHNFNMFKEKIKDTV